MRTIRGWCLNLMNDSPAGVGGTPRARRIAPLALAAALALLLAGGSAAFAQCVDHDGDGYQPNSASDPNCPLPKGDCNDDAPSIHPGAPELCGDLIDNNCNGMVDEGFVIGTESGVPPTPGDPNSTYDCNDGIDNDGDGLTDLDDPDCQAAQCVLSDPQNCCAGLDEPPGQGCTGMDPNGCCLTIAFYQCDPSDRTKTFCAEPTGGILMQAPEGPAPDPSCSDSEDNNCNGLIDVAEPSCQVPETCNGIDDDGSGRESAASTAYDCNDGIDNDGDGLTDILDPGCAAGIDDTFPTLGDSCTVGTGACEATGSVICDGPNSTKCSISPGAPQMEGPFGSASCSDGIDNNCDGLTDFPADPNCTEAEICDGLDNNGDGMTDEGFPSLGDACEVGTGACYNTGTLVCNGAGTGTVCDAAPGVASQEGPTGPTCSDGIDNDCDGLTDSDDPGCGSAQLAVTCAMLPVRGQKGADCGEWRTLHYDVQGVQDPNNLQIDAELLAIDENGMVMASLPVDNGDLAHLKSTTDPDSWKWVERDPPPGLTKHQNRTSKGNRFGWGHRWGKSGGTKGDNWKDLEMFAPIPLFRVQVHDGMNEAVAYCSHMPYLDVTRPTGQVISGTQGTTPVVAAIPRVDPSSLSLGVDGVDIISGLGVDPLTCTRATPCSGTLAIGSSNVGITDLIIDSAPLSELSSNTVTMNVTGLGCGDHVFLVDGQARPGVLNSPLSPLCYVDDLSDRGDSSTFAVNITSPVAQSVNNPVPTPVTGDACHGREITSLRINGEELDTSAQTVTVLDQGTPYERKVVDLPINTTIGQTDLARDIEFGDTPLGTFDQGSNRLIADAQDDVGTRVFDTLIFATGTVANPGIPATSSVPGAPATVNQIVQRELKRAYRGDLQKFAKSFLKDAFASNGTIGVEVPNAFVVGIKSAPIEKVFQAKCARAGQQFADKVRSKLLSKPPTTKKVSVPCSCDPTITIQTTDVQVDPNDFTCPISFSQGKFNVTVNLPDVRIFTTVSGRCKTTFLGICIAKTTVSGYVETRFNNVVVSFDVTEDQLKGNPNPNKPSFSIDDPPLTLDANASVDISCIGGDICEALVTVFTFGTVDVSPDIDVSKDVQFDKDVGASEPDPISLDAVQIDQPTLKQYDQEADSKLDSVSITPDGIVAGLSAKFKTSMLDPSVTPTPGSVITANNTLPTPNAPGTGDTYLAISDDVFNQLFASMRLAGKLNSGCKPSSKTVGDLIPLNCENLTTASDGATAAARGLCYGVRGDDCETIEGPTLLLTPVEQGICHGTQGDSCTGIPVGPSGIVWPSDCESLSFQLDPNQDPNAATDPSLATAVIQGICYAEHGANCETLTSTTDQLTATKQGACHGEAGDACQNIATVLATAAREKGTCEGVSGTTCSSLGLAQTVFCIAPKLTTDVLTNLLTVAEQNTCDATPARNVNVAAADPLLFCATTDMPPRLLIHDDKVTTPDAVETAIRLNDLSVAMLVDRNAATSPGLDGPLSATPGCFDPGAPTTGDCLLYGVCLDLNFNTTMSFDNSVCAAGKPGLKTKVDSVQTLIRQQGVVCNAATATADPLLTAAGASNDTISELMNHVDMFTPPSCADGFGLSENLQYGPSTFKLVSIDTDPNSDPGNTLQEYIAITGLIAP